MGYLELLNQFYELLQQDRLTPNAQLLYYTLLQIDNKCGWAQWFKRTNVSLCGLMGMGEKALMTARNELKQRGLIDFVTSKKRGESTKYSILYAAKAGTTQVERQKNGSRGQEKSTDIIRQRQRKRQEEKSPLISPEEIEALVAQHTQNPELRQAIWEFALHRQNMQRPFTRRSLALMLDKLEQMYARDEDKIQCLNQSIMNAWQGIFALPQKGQEGTVGFDYSQRSYAPGELEVLTEDVEGLVEM